jgi:hypothetical protein
MLELLPFFEHINRILHCAYESLICAINERELPEGNWFGPLMLSGEGDTNNVQQPTQNGYGLLVASLVTVQIMLILAALDITSQNPKVLSPGVIEDIRARCAEVCAGISGIFDE